MDGTFIVEQSDCKNVIDEIIKCIKQNKYYKAIMKLEFLKENFTVEEVEGILGNTYFSEFGDFISGMLCYRGCENCCKECGSGECCEGAGTCISCLVISYITAKCIPGCGSIQDLCVNCACTPCSCCTQNCLPGLCEGCFDECCDGCC